MTLYFCPWLHRVSLRFRIRLTALSGLLVVNPLWLLCRTMTFPWSMPQLVRQSTKWTSIGWESVSIPKQGYVFVLRQFPGINSNLSAIKPPGECSAHVTYMLSKIQDILIGTNSITEETRTVRDINVVVVEGNVTAECQWERIQWLISPHAKRGWAWL